MPKLTIVFDDEQEIIVPLADRITVGSAEDNDVVVEDERLSPHHAELLLNADGSVQVFDLKSTAGTWVNGQRVLSHTLLDGDKIAFGPLKAVMDLELSSAVLAPTTPPVRAPSSQTASVKPSTKTRRVDLPAPPPSAPPEPKEIPSEALRAAENRLALLEAAAKQAETTHREWMASIERLGVQHEEKTAAVAKLRAEQQEKTAILAKMTAEQDERSAALARLKAQQEERAIPLAALDAKHEERLAAINRLASQYDEKVVALAKLELQHEEKSAALARLAGQVDEKAAALSKLEGQHEERATALAAITRQQSEQAALLQQAAGAQEKLDALRANEVQASARLAEVQENLRGEEARLVEVRGQLSELEKQGQEVAAASKMNTEEALRAQERLRTATEELRVTQAQVNALADRMKELAITEGKLAIARRDSDEAEKGRSILATAILGLQTERQHQEQALTAVENRLAEAQEALAECSEDLAEETKRLEQARATRASIEAANSAPMEDIRARLERARHELGLLHARLMPLRDWKEAQERRLAHLATVPPDSAEARELLREIDSEAADLLRIVNIPPSRTPRIIQVESPQLTGVPMKSGHMRVSQP